jgi:penicillin amidase
MAIITIPASPPRRRRRPWWILALLLIAILVAALGGLAWLYSMARSALPQLDGSVKIAGLSKKVTVSRDGHGVPTIDAASLEDLFFAQGYVTAQDRLWQMDVMRRFAAGEISEILGADFIKHDREQRILGLRVAAQKALDVSSPQTRGHFEAYARGVNAYIESHRDRLPIEFRILRYSPRLWGPEDSTLIAAQMVKDLNHYPYGDALDREKILAKLGPELTADLYVNSSWHDRPPTVAHPSLEQNIDSDGEDQDKRSPVDSSVARQSPALRDLVGVGLAGAGIARWLKSDSDADVRMVVGSNNWVVSGAHTVSGKPLLSNDMHLGHQMPNLWYEAHLRCDCGNFDAAGVTLPGMPYVVVGHNQRVAWGFTNIGPTVEDVYVETFNPDGQYMTPEGWKPAEHRREVIHVKGKADVEVAVILTRHGPIITDLVPGETRKLALRWTLYEGTHNPFFDVDTAQNWEQFRRAFSALDAPGQNVVFADVDGNVGYQATGKVPIRASGDGSLPENGSDDAYKWTGYIPFDKLPSSFNPPSGIIATANGRIAPDKCPFSISIGWEAPWRTARIYRVLESGKKFSAADMLALQTDIYSDGERFFAERFVYAVDHVKNASARAKQAAELMRAWDGRMSVDSPAPTIGYHARVELTRLLLEPKLGAAPTDSEQAKATLNWKTYSWGMQSVWLENILQHQPKRWLPESYGSYDELLVAAVEATVSGPEAPKDLGSWHWGAFHPVAIQHPILGRVLWLQRWTGPGGQPQSGSGYTVKAVSRNHGPSERLTVDLSDLDQTTLNLVTGEAGNFLSPYYMDQWKAWYEDFTFRLPYSAKAVQAAQRHELVMEPR